MSFVATFSGLILLLHASLLHAATLSVATASNFSETLKQLAPLFQQASGHELRISAASSGKLYAQIRHGAPYDLFFSADAARPIALEQEGHGLKGSRITYALGQLALWAPGATGQAGIKERLIKGDFRRLAMANPKTAPYGLAAQETLKALDLWASHSGAIARGENIGQTFQFVATGNADIGFVALTQLRQADIDPAEYWVIPRPFYPPIEQQAIILGRTNNHQAAEAFLEYIGTADAVNLLQDSGYRLGDKVK